MTLLGELADINPRDAIQSRGPFGLISMADVDTASATATPRVISDRREAGSANRPARAGDVIFARITPSMENGKIAIVPAMATVDQALVSGELVVLRPKAGIDPRWIWAFLRQDDVRAQLRKFMIGSTGQQRLSPSILAQTRLIERNPGEEARERGLLALEHLDSALRYAHELLVALEQLPASAAEKVGRDAGRAPLRDFGVEMTYGTNARSIESGDVAMLRIPNVVEGWLTDGDLRYLPPREASRAPTLQPDDLLVVRTNGNPERLGRAALYEGVPEEATFASYLIRIRTAASLAPDFLWAWFRTQEARSALLARARTSAGQYNLNFEMLQDLNVPALSLRGQADVATAARIARRASQHARTQVDVTRAAIQAHLTKMFSASTGSDGVSDSGSSSEVPSALPYAFAFASPGQQALWRRIETQPGSFAVEDVMSGDIHRAEIERLLAMFEQLGVLIRERVDDLERWRHPDPEAELIS